MGYRTVVVLFNDQASEWENDPALGKKIAAAMHRVSERDSLAADLHYGRVVECVHADTQTLAVLDGYQFNSVTYSHWTRNEPQDSIALKLVKAAADKLGFRLVKKTTKVAEAD